MQKRDRALVHSWLEKPYVAKWFYGDGLENTYKGIDDFLAGSSEFTFWLAHEGDIPFALLITSTINKPEDELTRWCESTGKTITLDMLIGDENYLGKGFAHRVIKEFLSIEFSDIEEVLIDPETTNERAIHVYEKAGFSKIGEFIPSHNLHPHTMMRMTLK